MNGQVSNGVLNRKRFFIAKFEILNVSLESRPTKEIFQNIWKIKKKYLKTFKCSYYTNYYLVLYSVDTIKILFWLNFKCIKFCVSVSWIFSIKHKTTLKLMSTCVNFQFTFKNCFVGPISSAALMVITQYNYDISFLQLFQQWNFHLMNRWLSSNGTFRYFFTIFVFIGLIYCLFVFIQYLLYCICSSYILLITVQLSFIICYFVLHE